MGGGRGQRRLKTPVLMRRGPLGQEAEEFLRPGSRWNHFALKVVSASAMKTTRLLMLSSLGLAAVVALRAADEAKPAARTQVIFFEAEGFTDVRDTLMSTERGREAILDQLKTYLQERAKYYVPEGQNLIITITDVDLAGDFEPARSARWQDVRIVKDIYPPRIDLSFKLTAADGTVLKQGEHKLCDLTFLMKLSINTSDPLRHEKALLDDWLRADFARGR